MGGEASACVGNFGRSSVEREGRDGEVGGFWGGREEDTGVVGGLVCVKILSKSVGERGEVLGRGVGVFVGEEKGVVKD